VKYFTTPDQMATVIVDDMCKSIEQDFPITKANPLQRELKDNQTFADMRTRVYIGGQEYMDALDKYVLQGGPPGIVVVGPSGSGKSTLLANWMKRFKARQQISYFEGAKYVPQDDDSNAGAGAAGVPPRLHQRRASLSEIKEQRSESNLNIVCILALLIFH
jgi:ABC-type glutathione transport system ATPase component